MTTLRAVLFAGAAAVALAGCDRIGNPFEVLSGQRAAPDEFQVVTRKPLRMPSSLDLPEPRLGERSPLEHDPHSEAVSALMPGQATAGGTGASAGERALLTAASANADTAEVNARLVAAEEAATAGKPYEPPTLLELLNLDGNRAKDVLDPDTEARRLMRTGASTAPVNPAAEPEEEAATDNSGYVSPGEKFEPKFPYGPQQRRRN